MFKYYMTKNSYSYLNMKLKSMTTTTYLYSKFSSNIVYTKHNYMSITNLRLITGNSQAAYIIQKVQIKNNNNHD